MDQTVGHTHADARAAEAAAALAVAPHLRKMKAAIFAAVLAAGDRGLTPDELLEKVGGIINTVRRRVTDLWKEGELRPTDRTRRNKRGNPETVWVVGRDEKAAVGTFPRSKIEQLKKAVRALVNNYGGTRDGADMSDSYVLVRRQDFDALDKLNCGQQEQATPAKCLHPAKRNCNYCGESFCPNEGCDPNHRESCREAMRP